MKNKFTPIDAFIIILLVIGIYLTLRYLFGNTPTEIILFSFIFTILISLIFRIENKLFKTETRLEQKIDRIETKITEEFKKIKENTTQPKK